MITNALPLHFTGRPSAVQPATQTGSTQAATASMPATTAPNAPQTVIGQTAVNTYPVHGAAAGNRIGHHQTATGDARTTDDDRASAGTPRSATGEPLSDAALETLHKLQSRDQEVRQHEQAHQSAGGRYAGAASFTYERGPDGQLYATGGEVSIDASVVSDDPQATIRKMRTVRAAALAPAQPSAQDMRVAAQAMQAMIQAQLQLTTTHPDDTASDSRPGTSTNDASNHARGHAASAYAAMAGNSHHTAGRTLAHA